MFEVVGRDARGKRRTIAVYVSSEEEARESALRSGDIVTVEEVRVPRTSTGPAPSEAGAAFGIVSCVLFVVVLLCVSFMALIAHDLTKADPPDGLAEAAGSLVGSLVGPTFLLALGGIVVGVGLVGFFLGLLGAVRRAWAGFIGALLNALAILAAIGLIVAVR